VICRFVHLQTKFSKMRIVHHMFFLSLILSWLSVSAMFNKRASYVDKEGGFVPPPKRLRANIQDLLMGGEVSARRARVLAEDGQSSRAEHLEDVVRAGCSGRFPGNISRDLVRRFLKKRKWPPLYHAYIRVWDLKSQSVKRAWVAMLLPHELVQALASKSEGLTDQSNLTPVAKGHLDCAASQMGVPAGDLVFCGLWGDGVPFN
jgi:hypothetical protein